MKALNKTFLTLIFVLSTLFSGCLPDSTKKFKDDNAATQTNTTSSEPTAVSYTTKSLVANLSQALTALSPTVTWSTGTGTGTYAVSPDFPAGISINQTTGVISGTPTVLTDPTDYTVTIGNTQGKATTTVSISVVAPTAPKDLKYAETKYRFTRNVNIGSISPSVTGTVSSYSISPALPTGLSFNTASGEITGTPTIYSSAQNYVIEASNIAGSSTTTISIGSYNLPSNLSYTQSSNLELTLTSVTGLSVNDTITSDGIAATIISVNSTDNSILIKKADNNPYSVNSTVVESATTIGTINKINNVYRPDQSFDLTPSLATGEEAVYSITPDISSGMTFNTETGKIDGTVIHSTPTTYYNITATNPVGSKTIAFGIGLIIEKPEALTYTQNAILKVSTTDQFHVGDLISSNAAAADQALGIIKEINTSNYTLIVRTVKGVFKPNDSIDNNYPFKSSKAELNSFVKIYIDDTNDSDANFDIEGDISNSNAAMGKIVYRESNNSPVPDVLYVKTLNGMFNSLENVYPSLNGSGTPVQATDLEDDDTVTYYNGVFSLNNNTDYKNFKIDGDIYSAYVPTTTTSKGIVSYINNTDNKIYVKMYSNTFKSATATLNLYNNSNTTGSVQGISEKNQFDNIKLKLAGLPTGLVLGADITQNPGGLTEDAAVGYVSSTDGLAQPTITVNTYDKVFQVGKTIRTTNPYAHYSATGAMESITSELEYDNTFYLYVRKSSIIKATTKKNIPLTYSINPELPTGLELNSTTGDISGTPTDPMPKKAFTITAINVKDEPISYEISIKILDHFEFTNKTGDAGSYIMHKSGRGNMRRPCMVTDEVINGSEPGLKQIKCYLEGGEKELFQLGAKLGVNVGASMCNFVEVESYYFYKWQYKVTAKQDANPQDANFTTYNIPASCLIKNCVKPGETAPGNACTSISSDTPKCDGDYTDQDGPNCDTGSYTVLEYTFEDSNSADPAVSCTITGSEVKKTVECGGKQVNCIEGPFIQKDESKDILIPRYITTSYSGLPDSDSGSNVWTLPAPDSDSLRYKTNLFIANFTLKNQCYDTTETDGYSYYDKSWYNYRSELTNYSDPFQNGNPYYIARCKNESQETKAEILLQVREWNYDFSADDEIDKINPDKLRADKDVAALNPTTIFNEIGVGGVLDDYMDWDGSKDYTPNSPFGIDLTGLGDVTCDSTTSPKPATSDRYYKFPEQSL